MKDSTTLSIPIRLFVMTWQLGDIVLVKIVRRRKKIKYSRLTNSQLKILVIGPGDKSRLLHTYMMYEML